MKCPVCGGSRIVEDRGELIRLMHANGYSGERSDSDGRVLNFGDRELRLTGECDVCDEKNIREFIGAPK